MYTCQRGFSLSETLVSLLITSTIMLGLIKIYLAFMDNSRNFKDSIHSEIEIYNAIDFLQESIKKASFTPCLISGIKQELINLDQNKLTISRMSENYDVVDTVLNSTSLLTQDSIIKKSSTVVVADCFHAEVINVKSITKVGNGQLITLASKLQNQYQTPIFIGEFIKESYYVNEKINSLYYEYKKPEELTKEITKINFNKRDKSIDVLLWTKYGQKLSFTTAMGL